MTVRARFSVHLKINFFSFERSSTRGAMAFCTLAELEARVIIAHGRFTGQRRLFILVSLLVECCSYVEMFKSSYSPTVFPCLQTVDFS